MMPAYMIRWGGKICIKNAVRYAEKTSIMHILLEFWCAHPFRDGYLRKFAMARIGLRPLFKVSDLNSNKEYPRVGAISLRWIAWVTFAYFLSFEKQMIPFFESVLASCRKSVLSWITRWFPLISNGKDSSFHSIESSALVSNVQTESSISLAS